MPGLAMSVDDLLRRAPDLVCIASSTSSHLGLLRDLAARPPKLILCEKPIGGGGEEIEAAVRALRRSGVVVAVNYPRRWLAALSAWCRSALAGEYGRPLSATVQYGKGLRNNGSHAVNLLLACLGEGEIRILQVDNVIDDGAPGDPTASVFFVLAGNHGDVPVWLQGVSALKQTIFTVEILFERSRIRVEDSDGIMARLDLQAPVAVSGYASELRPAETVRDLPPRLFGDVWRNLADVLDGAAVPACDADDALATARMVRQLSSAVALQ